MMTNDRDRLALSTLIAIGLYVVIFLLLLGFHWPPNESFRSLTPPVSLSVSLVSLQETPSPPVTHEPPPLQSGASAAAPQAPAGVHAAPSTAPASPPPPAQAASSASVAPAANSQNPSPPASYFENAAPVPTQGPQGGPSSASSAGSQGSAQPGINYAAQSGGSPMPAQGGAVTGGGANSATSYGPATTGAGSSLNPQLVEQAGQQAAGSGSGAQGGAVSSSVAGGSGSASATGGSASGDAAGGGPEASIEWSDKSAKRQVAFEPPRPTIPQRYLAELPPKIDLTITFVVDPSGTVNALSISPSLGYPELDNLFTSWMDQWRFNSTAGGPEARGTLQYVIQATTSR
jgi:hypothetical protein